MSFEERIDRLTERHEALIQAVELLTAMRTENEKRAAGRSAEAAMRSAELDKQFAETDRRLGQVLRKISKDTALGKHPHNQ